MSTAAGPYQVAVPPEGYSTLITTTGDRITVGVRLSWSDAGVTDLGSFTVNRPGTCAEAAGTGTASPPPTTCAQAIPPRADCAGRVDAAPAAATTRGPSGALAVRSAAPATPPAARPAGARPSATASRSPAATLPATR